jgi:hypothetical protein
MLVALCTGALLSSGPAAFAAGAPAVKAQTRTPAASRPTKHVVAPSHPVAASRPVHTAAPAPKAAVRVAPVVHHAPKAAPVRPAPVIHAPAAKPAAHPAVVKKAAAQLFSAARTPVKEPYTEHGIVMHYYPGLFETVARNRGMYMRKDVDGYASRQNCGELGRVVEARVRNPYNGVWGPWRRYQILDCSARQDVGYHRQIGLILEIDYNSAVATGIAWRGRSEVDVRP